MRKCQEKAISSSSIVTRQKLYDLDGDTLVIFAYRVIFFKPLDNQLRSKCFLNFECLFYWNKALAKLYLIELLLYRVMKMFVI